MTMSDGDHGTETEQQENQTEAPFLIPGARNPLPPAGSPLLTGSSTREKDTVTKVG